MRASLALAMAVAVLAPSAASAAAPHVNQLVVFPDGPSRLRHPSTGAATVTVGKRRCAVARGTPLAALAHSGIGPLSLRDYGACSSRGADGGGIFVAGIGPAHNRGSDGWVYKVGNVLGTAGAADPAGPFGRGRLRRGARVTWFWCHVTARDRGCPHTLVATVRVQGHTLVAHVRQYDDHGRGAAAVGAVVHAANDQAAVGRDGVARLTVPGGRYAVWAEQRGRIRSFTERVTVG